MTLLWIDGQPIPSARNVAFHRDALISTDPELGRCFAYSVVSEDPRAGAVEGQATHYRVQAHFADGPRTLLGLSCRCVAAWLGLTYRGMFFELHEQPHPRGELIHSGLSEIVLAIDGLVVLDPIVEASLERIDRPDRDPWVSTMLRLRLAPGHAPSRWLASLCQRRPARRLVVRIDGETFLLEELGTTQARMIGATQRAWKGPAADGVELELMFESRPPERLDRSPDLDRLPMRLDRILDPTLDPQHREQLREQLRSLLINVGDAWGKRTRRWMLAEPLPERPEDWARRIQCRPPRGAKELEIAAFTSEANVDLAAATASLRDAVARWREREPHMLPDIEVSVRVAPIAEVLPALEAQDAALGARAPDDRTRISDALARDHDPLTRSVAEQLDRAGIHDREAWAVFTDYLQQRGDPRGELLARLQLGADPAALEPKLIATLDRRERQLRATPPGGVPRFGEREWSPRVWATWVGPMIVQLAIQPGWTRVVDDDGLYTRATMLDGGLQPDWSFMQRRLQRRGESFDLQAWQSVPGFDAFAELERLLALPCCALLSPRRILEAGRGPRAWFQRVCVDLSGADLRGIELAHTELTNCNFRGANFSGATFIRIELHECDLRDIELRDAIVDHVKFESCDLRGASWREAKTFSRIWTTDVQANPELVERLAAIEPQGEGYDDMVNPFFG